MPKILHSNRGFVFPFVIFIVVAGVFVVSQIYLYNASNNDADEFARIEAIANIQLENQATVFRRILTATNSNGSGTGAGADNDDYLLTGSGWTGTDDDTDAFRYRFGTLLPGESRNILYVDPSYLPYTTIGSLSNLSALPLLLTSTGKIEVYSLDIERHVFGSFTMTGGLGTNTISLTGITMSDSLAVFLTNTSTGAPLSYTLSASGITSFVSATHLWAGKYRYYSSFLIPDSQGVFLPFSRTFSN